MKKLCFFCFLASFRAVLWAHPNEPPVDKAVAFVSVDTSITEIDTTICPGDTIKIGNKGFPKTGTYTINLKDAQGRDSIVMLKLTVLPSAVHGGVFPSYDTLTNTWSFVPEPGFVNKDNYFKFQWSTGDTTQSVFNLNAAKYCVTVTSIKGCVQVSCWIFRDGEPFEMPNAFTPNGDGLNDLFAPIFFPTFITHTITVFKIYNRMGQLVYNNEERDIGWDGTYKGQDAPSDVYVYVIELDFGKGRILRGSGEVNLIR